jgi:serine/threonine-protein kinase
MALVVRPLARALEAAHDKNVIHRDLKPENVFLVEVPHDLPHVKLLDFGVAKLAKKPGSDLTDSNAILGTPMYISPEQARSPNGAGPQSDIYSLGAIAFELLTGRPPFQGKNAMEMVSKHIDEVPVAPSSIVEEIPEEIDRLVLEMLAKEPGDRPTLGHVRAVLDLVKDPSEVQVAPRSITVRASTPSTGMPQTKREPEHAVSVRFARKSDPGPPVAATPDASGPAPVAIAPSGPIVRPPTEAPAAAAAPAPAEATPTPPRAVPTAPGRASWIPWIALAVVAIALATVVVLVF